MSATGEVDNPPVEKPAAEATVAEEPQAAENPVEEKKPRAPKTASHPPYFQGADQSSDVAVVINTTSKHKSGHNYVYDQGYCYVQRLRIRALLLDDLIVSVNFPTVVSHPPYFQMIKDALLSLNEKTGSSTYAIAKYMEEKLKAVLPANFRKTLGLQLKNSVAKGKLIKIRASYKLSEAGKKENQTSKTKTPKAATTEAKKPKRAAVPKGKGSDKRKPEAAKKTGPKRTRKTTAVKPKQPRSIKSPAAKRARKATASA